MSNGLVFTATWQDDIEMYAIHDPVLDCVPGNEAFSNDGQVWITSDGDIIEGDDLEDAVITFVGGPCATA